MLMHKRSLVFLLALAAVPAAARELADDRGIRIDVPPSPPRIAVLSPHLAEIAFAAGAGGEVVGAVRYSDYPEAAKRLPRIGDADRIDVERVVALKPDLILAWRSGNPAADVQRLEHLGFRVFVTEQSRLSDIARVVRTVGTLAGTEAEAERAADAFEAELAHLRRQFTSRVPVRVFYEIWHRPLLTVNGKHLISDVISLCGGENVFAKAAVLTPTVSVEAVLAARPQMVLGGSSATRPDALQVEWRHAPVPALREIPVRYVPADLIQRATPRIAQGARIACEHIDDVRRGTHPSR